MGGCGTPARSAGAVSSIASLPLVRRLVQPGNDCAAAGPNAPPLETRDAVEALLHALKCGIQPRLADPYRQVATCLLEDSTGSVGRAAQIAGNSVGIVQRNQQGVDLVHVGEQRLALIELAQTHAIQHIAPQLADGLTQSVEIGRPFDAQLVSGGPRGARD